MTRRLPTIAVIGAVGLIYFAAGRFGLSLATIHPSASAIWPPTGVAIAAALLFGPRVWPGILAGAFLVNLTSASGPLTSAIIASGNTLEALVAARLTARYARGAAAFERPTDVFRYAVLAGLVATAVSATIGVTGLVVTGHASASDYAPVWLTWWLGDASGAILIAPLLILAAQARVARVNAAAVIEGLVLAGSIVLFGAALFGGFTSFSVEHRPLQFFAFPLLAWAAFRFGLLGAAAGSCAIEAIAIWGTLRGFGPFAGGDRNDALLLLQMFGMTASVTVLALAAAIAARQRAEQQLRQTERRMREIAEEAARLREEFLSIATHELRTPVTSVKGYAQLALRDLESRPEKARSALDAIVRQSDRLAALVSQLLDASRIGRGDLSIERAPTDISALVSSAVEAAMVRDHGHAWSVRISPGVAGYVDPVRIDQLVGNLLDNAARYSPGGSTISVGLESSGGSARLEVADQGLGIPADRLPRVFDRFYRAHEEQRLGGLGLGLHLSREIAEAHGGSIAVRSEVAKGSVFVVHLPTTAVATTSDPIAPEAARPRARGRVLVVDDEPDIRRLVAEVLESAGCSVTLAQDGARALELSRRERPDLIVLDKLMPVMDGTEFARAYRKSTTDPAPIVGFCAARDVESWSASIGAVAFIGKPFDVDHFEQVVLEQLASSADGRPPPPPRLQ